MANLLDSIVFNAIADYEEGYGKGDLQKQFSNRFYFCNYDIPFDVFNVEEFKAHIQDEDVDNGDVLKDGTKKACNPYDDFKSRMRTCKENNTWHNRVFKVSDEDLRKSWPLLHAIPWVRVESSKGIQEIDLLSTLDEFCEDWEFAITPDIGKKFFSDIKREMLLYGQLKENISRAGVEAPSVSLFLLQHLLPAWIAKGTIDLFNCGFWEDSEQLELVLSQICDAMVERKYSEDIIELYREKTKIAIDAYTSNPLYAGCFDELSVVDIYDSISKAFHDAKDNGNEAPSFYVAFWDSINPITGRNLFTNDDPVKWKTALIWNFLICPIYGPERAELKEDVTARQIKESFSFGLPETSLHRGSGDAVIMRLKDKDSPDSQKLVFPGLNAVVRLDDVVNDARTPLLFIGRELDSAREECKGRFLSTGDKDDSAVHVEIFMEKGTLYLSDAGSTNGTYVVRLISTHGSENTPKKICMAFNGRNVRTVENLRKSRVYDEVEDRTGKSVALHRGDRISLSGSDFQIL